MFVLAFMLSLAPALADQSSAGCVGFSGVWLTTWPGGTTKLRIERERGTYDFHDGIISGTLDGNVFTGVYSETDSNGTFWFQLLADGNSFKGWYATSSDSNQHYYWRGICLGPL